MADEYIYDVKHVARDNDRSLIVRCPTARKSAASKAMIWTTWLAGNTNAAVPAGSRSILMRAWQRTRCQPTKAFRDSPPPCR